MRKIGNILSGLLLVCLSIVAPSALSQDVVKMDAIELLAERFTNKMRFERNYKSKILEVSGAVEDIKDKRKGHYSIELLASSAPKSKRGLNSTIVCSIPAENPSSEAVFDLNKGDQIVVVGAFNSYALFGRIKLSDCAILQK